MVYGNLVLQISPTTWSLSLEAMGCGVRSMMPSNRVAAAAKKKAEIEYCI